MKKFITILFVLLSAISMAQPNVILDEDFVLDVDDIGGLLMVMGEHKKGHINLIGVHVSSGYDYSAPAVRSILDYYGLSAIPVGAYQSGIETSAPNWATVTRDQFRPTDDKTNYNNSNDFYSGVLSTAADNSVIIIIAGFATPVMNARTANTTLFDDKVSKYVVIAGMYPTSVGHSDPGQPANAEYNIWKDPTGWNALASTDKVIEWGGAELGNTSHNAFPTDQNPNNPATYALDYFFDVWAPAHSTPIPAPNERQSWSELAVIRALYPQHFNVSAQGHNSINTSTGSNTFSATTSYQQYYFTKSTSDAALKVMIEQMIYDATDTGVLGVF